MKANELMAGAFVYFECFDGSKIIVRVKGFNDGIVYGDSENGSHWCVTEKVKPIPLTAEILEKNGFVPDNFSPYYLPIEDGSVRFSNHQYGLYCNILRPYQRYDGVCNYVHNLQHALRLCGIDKEIVL